MSNEKVQYKMFRGVLASWNNLFLQAAGFASSIPPEKLISISHSADNLDRVVTVWYRE
ncbi:MAG: hypothetical protein V1799_21585 [bacterium]